MTHIPINLVQKLSLFSEPWSPRIVAELNDYQVKLAHLKGEFVWHQHAETDELFLCLEGKLSILLRDGQVDLQAGELYVVPRGVEHKPVSPGGCSVMLVEPRGVVNTGETQSELTAEGDRWV